jgi:hypothetical protein
MEGLGPASTTSQFRHSSMECQNPGDMGVSGRIRRTWMPAIHAGTTNALYL